MSEPSRRRFLAGAGAAGLLAGTGCLRRLQTAATTVDYPATPAPDYRRWLPAPGTLPDGEAYDAMHLRLAPLVGNDDIPGRAASNRNLFARTGRDPLGIAPEQIETVVKVDLVTATVLLGSFDTEAVAAAADRAGYQRDSTHRDFELYQREERPYAAAVAGDAVVQTRHDEPLAVARSVIDAGRGETDRYHEVDPDFAQLTDAASGTVSWIHSDGGLDSIEGVVRAASGQAFVDDRAFFEQVYLFEDADAASEDTVRGAVAGRGNLPRTAPLDVTVEGRVGRAEYARDAAEVFDRDRPLQPIVAWSIEPSGSALTVTHRAGDEVRADRLTLRNDDGPTDRQFDDEYDTVGPGDSVTVSVASDAGLRVVWEFDRSTVTMARYSGEE